MRVSKKVGFRIGLSCLVAVLAFSLVGNARVSAVCANSAISCSSSYSVGQVFFGSGGSLNSTCSSSYCAKQSVGETGVGLSSGGSYQAYSGFNTNREPYLQFIVNPANINLGVLSVGSTATGTATFSVKNYLSSGYSIYTYANPPTSEGGHIFNSYSTPTAVNPGIEEFGMNLVSNTTSCGAPINFGSNPVQVPSSQFSYGQVAVGYDQCGKYQYVNNSVIADSLKSSGETDFTISYIADISNTTPAGLYTMNESLIAVPTY